MENLVVIASINLHFLTAFFTQHFQSPFFGIWLKLAIETRCIVCEKLHRLAVKDSSGSKNHVVAVCARVPVGTASDSSTSQSTVGQNGA